jgi:hypothetical protein
MKDRENIIRSSYPHPINLGYGYRSDRTSVIYAEAVFTRGEAITTNVVREDVIVTSRFEGDDIPPGKTELQDGDGLGSLIRVTEDQEEANCTLEFDEVMNVYVVRCMISRENISEKEELVLLGPKLVKSKRDIIYSTLSSFVGSKPVEVNRAEVIREVTTSEVQTEAMEEEEAAFIESDLEQYELCREVVPVREYIDKDYASILYDEVMGTMREHRREFLAAGFVKMVSDADHLFGQKTIQHGLFQEAADNIREKDVAKIAGAVNCLDKATNYVTHKGSKLGFLQPHHKGLKKLSISFYFTHAIFSSIFPSPVSLWSHESFNSPPTPIGIMVILY